MFGISLSVLYSQFSCESMFTKRRRIRQKKIIHKIIINLVESKLGFKIQILNVESLSKIAFLTVKEPIQFRFKIFEKGNNCAKLHATSSSKIRPLTVTFPHSVLINNRVQGSSVRCAEKKRVPKANGEKRIKAKRAER